MQSLRWIAVFVSECYPKDRDPINFFCFLWMSLEVMTRADASVYASILPRPQMTPVWVRSRQLQCKHGSQGDDDATQARGIVARSTLEGWRGRWSWSGRDLQRGWDSSWSHGWCSAGWSNRRAVHGGVGRDGDEASFRRTRVRNTGARWRLRRRARRRRRGCWRLVVLDAELSRILVLAGSLNDDLEAIVRYIILQ